MVDEQHQKNQVVERAEEPGRGIMAGKIWFYRQSDGWMRRSFTPFTVWLDGTAVAKLSDREGVIVDAPAGKHDVVYRTFAESPVAAEVTVVEESVLAVVLREPEVGNKALVTMTVVELLSLRSPVEISNIRETHRSEESIGTETRTIENPAINTRVVRTYRATRTWTQEWSFAEEISDKLSSTTQLGQEWARVALAVETAFKSTYSLKESQQEEFSEEVSLEIQPKSRVMLSLRWKRIWQHGTMTMRSPIGSIGVPFKIVRGVTFDQSLTDI